MDKTADNAGETSFLITGQHKQFTEVLFVKLLSKGYIIIDHKPMHISTS